MVDGLVEGVRADADRGPAEVELPDVHGVERRVPGVVALGEDVRLGDGIVVERELRDEVLAVDDVLHALVLLVRGIRDEEDVLAAPRELPERRDHRRLVGVADVVLPAARAVRSLTRRDQAHLRGVHVGAVLLLGEPEREDAAVLEMLGGAAFHGLVAAHPDRAEAEHGDLPRVPVLQAVECKDLRELADPPGVPARPGTAVARGRAHGGEDALALHEVQEIRVPDARVVVGLQTALPLALEEVDRAEHDLARALVGICPPVVLRVQENHASRRRI